MRFLYAIIAITAWALFIAWLIKGGMEVPSNTVMIYTSAIIAAGAMAGGD